MTSISVPFFYVKQGGLTNGIEVSKISIPSELAGGDTPQPWRGFFWSPDFLFFYPLSSGGPGPLCPVAMLEFVKEE